MLRVFDLSGPEDRRDFDAMLAKLRATTAAHSEAAQAVAQMIADVRQRGDDAVAQYMRKWTDPDFDVDRIAVTAKECDEALASLDGDLRKAIERSIENVRTYQRHIMPRNPQPMVIDGAELGLRFSPVDSAGLAVPGGAAVLFSTLIMLAVPAQEAGVGADRISVINPPPTRSEGEQAKDISPIVMATCRMLGIERLYRIGGAQAIAALAYGTQRVKKVDFIAGPGNVFVQLAKQQVHGIVGTEGGFYGPSEIVTIADETAQPVRIAADLIAQAEHNPGKCFLVSWSRKVIDAIVAEVAQQLGKRSRRDAIEKAMLNESAAILTADEDQAVAIANTLAAEHVNLAVADVDAWLSRMRHGGEFFLGDQTPVAAGDYYAGPSHCLPTGTTARFASGVSVYTFLKRSGTVCYRNGMPSEVIDAVARLADAEGLDAHADSARVRG